MILSAWALALLFSNVAEAKDTLKDMGDFHYLVSNGILQGIFAKEMCTCHYVVGLPLDVCKEHSSLPEMAFTMIDVKENDLRKSITATPTIPISDAKAMAVYDVNHPRKGCRLVYGIKEFEANHKDDFNLFNAPDAISRMVR